jgi:hypothetical protein
VRFAEQGRKRHSEDLPAVLVADVQHPAAPIFQHRRHDERADDEGGVLLRLGQVGDGTAAPINRDADPIGTMEKEPQPCFASSRISKSEVQASSIAALW